VSYINNTKHEMDSLGAEKFDSD